MEWPVQPRPRGQLAPETLRTAGAPHHARDPGRNQGQKQGKSQRTAKSEGKTIAKSKGGGTSTARTPQVKRHVLQPGGGLGAATVVQEEIDDHGRES